MALSKAQTHLTITTVTFKSSPLQIKKNPGCEKDTTMTFVDSFILEFYGILFLIIHIALADGIYISQLIRYFRACVSYHNYLDRGFSLLCV